MALEMFPRDGVQRVCTVSQVFLAECQKLLASGSILYLAVLGLEQMLTVTFTVPYVLIVLHLDQGLF